MNMGTLQAADHMVLMVLGTGKWCYLAIKGGREGEGGIRSCSLLNEKKKKNDTEANSAFCFECTQLHTVSARRQKEKRTRREKTYRESWLMHLSDSIHFTAITVRSGGDGAHFSEKHGAFLSSEVSFLERLEGGKPLFSAFIDTDSIS